MITGPDLIVECPYCGQKVKHHTLVSGNNFGSVLWSDGREVAPMMPELPVFTFCDRCDQFYNIADAAIMGREYPGDTSSGCREQTEFIELPTFQEYIKAFEFLPDKKNARIKIMYSFNDIIRAGNKKMISSEMRDLHNRNLYELLSLLDESLPGELLLKAEIYRNLGLFEKSKLTLSKIADPDYNAVKEKYLSKINDYNKELLILF